MRYRAEIDGLRAIAVISVILFHLNIISGGFVGVDIFFVISGFLITNIVYNEIKNNNFNFINFYEKRIRRIFPALFFILFITTILTWLIQLPYDFIKFHKELISVISFSSNFYFFLDGDYFAVDSSLKPLLHTWSLSVEEQFYLFFPFFIIIFKNHIKFLFYSILIITLFSLIYSDHVSTSFNPINFYLIHTRFWEISFGALAALKYKKINLYFSKYIILSEIISISGFVMILISLFSFTESTPNPSFYTLLPTIGTLLIILFSKNYFINSILSNKIFVKIGLLSYSAYLIHQPLISFFKLYYIIDFNLVQKLWILTLILTISYFSYIFIESPFRDRNKIS